MYLSVLIAFKMTELLVVLQALLTFRLSGMFDRGSTLSNVPLFWPFFIGFHLFIEWAAQSCKLLSVLPLDVSFQGVDLQRLRMSGLNLQAQCQLLSGGKESWLTRLRKRVWNLFDCSSLNFPFARTCRFPTIKLTYYAYERKRKTGNGKEK